MSSEMRKDAFAAFAAMTKSGTKTDGTGANENVPPASVGGDGTGGDNPVIPTPSICPPAKTASHTSSRISQTVAQFLTDCDDDIDPNHVLVGMEDDVQHLSVLLTLHEAKNVLLYGPPGIGKSTVVQNIINNSATGDISLDLFKRTFYRLNTEALLACDDVAQINEHVREIVAFLERRQYGVLVIDNAWNFINGLSDKAALGALNRLMAAIGRGKFQSLMIVSDEHRDELVQTHPSFNELFTQHKLGGQNAAQILKTLRGKRSYYQDYYGIVISDDGLKTVAELSQKYPSAYAANLEQPGKAIRLLEFICASYRNKFMSKPEALIDLESEHRHLLLEKTSINGSDPERTAEIDARIDAIAPQRAALQSAWDEKTCDVLTINRKKKDIALKLERAQESRDDAETHRDQGDITKCERLIAGYQTEINALNARLAALNVGQPTDHPLERDIVLDLFSRFTGIDAAAAGQDELERIVNIEPFLRESVMGQDHAIRAVGTALRNRVAGFNAENRPIGAFFFLGPTGVGKTELARALDAAISGVTGSKPIDFDMSDYKEEHAVASLLGAPMGYKGASEGGILVNRVRAKPKSVVLFDEIEKAHPGVFDVLLPILDNGRIEDRRGVEARFNDSIIIVTSNIGAEYFLDPQIQEDEARQLATELLYKKIRPEILGRFHGIVFFNSLTPAAQFSITKKFLAGRNKLLDGSGFQLAMDDQDLRQVQTTFFDPTKGGRSLRNVFEGPISDAASNIIIQEKLKASRGAYGSQTKKPPGGIITLRMTELGGFDACLRPLTAASAAGKERSAMLT